jgi:serine/alanine adding enzyme
VDEAELVDLPGLEAGGILPGLRTGGVDRDAVDPLVAEVLDDEVRRVAVLDPEADPVEGECVGDDVAEPVEDLGELEDAGLPEVLVHVHYLGVGGFVEIGHDDSLRSVWPEGTGSLIVLLMLCFVNDDGAFDTMVAIMAMRPATDEELGRWDELVAANPDGGMALQTKTWGDFKSRWGWEPRRFVYELKDGRKVAAQWLVRLVPMQGEVWYCPKGPGVTSAADFAEVVKQTRAAGWGGVLARFESEVLDDEVDAAKLRGLGLVRANRDPGSKSTIFVDLSGGEEAVLASFNQTARRNIRKAAAAGVTVEPAEATDANLRTMFELMKTTEARAKYGLRPEAYFKDYWAAQAAAGQGQLFFARHEGDVLAGVFATFVGRRAWYKDGGSFDLKRELQAPYLIQWEVMRWLMERGITNYDLVGSPNRDEIGDATNSRSGLYEFKRKFNPDVTEFAGCWDLPLSELKYKAWRKVGERVAARLAARRPERFLY